MSSRKKNWTDGEALTTTELQRSADVGAEAEDRAHEILFPPWTVQKRVLPMAQETTAVYPRYLAAPGAANGNIKITPAKFFAGGPSLPYHMNMSATMETAADSPQIGSNSSGVTRYDLVYATIAYASSATGSRKQKNVSTGVVSTQTLTLEKAMSVTLGVVANVGNSTPLASLPSDAGDGSSYNFGLALVTVANGFSAGSAIAQSNITQLWNGAMVPESRIHAVRVASMMAAAIADSGSTPMVDFRWRGGIAIEGVIKHRNATTTFTIDSSVDWRNRIIRTVELYRPIAHTGTYPPPQSVTIPGLGKYVQGGGYYTGDGSALFNTFTATGAGAAGGNVTFAMFGTASGLTCDMTTSAGPADGTNGDNWFFHIEATDIFKF